MRYYVLIRLKDLSHVEANFNTREEVDNFLNKYKNNIIPHETIIEDRRKIQVDRNNEVLGWVIIIVLGLITLYFMFN